MENAEEITYDPESLPTGVDVQTLLEVQTLRDELATVNDAVTLLTQNEEESTADFAAAEIQIAEAQYEYLQRSMKMSNTLGLILVLMLGVSCGLSAWNAFTHSWGSHG